MEEREKDIQAVCKAILNFGIQNTGDSGMGGQCPFCYTGCGWNDDLLDILHEPNCPILIAKDLTTNIIK